MKNSPLRIGILGTANIARRSIIPVLQSLPQFFELKAIASRDQEKADQVAKSFGIEPVAGYQELIERQDIDAIYMPLPTGLHLEWGLAAIKQGKHLLSEKSLARSWSEVEILVDTARTAEVLLMENFMFTYHRQHTWVFDQMKAGTIGELRAFRSSFGFPPFTDKDNIRYQPELGGGALLDAGAYTLKAASMFLGDKVEVAAASMVFDPVKGVDIYGGALLINPEGVTAQLAWGFDNFYQCSYELWGSKGRIQAERAFTAPPGFKPLMIIEKQDERMELSLPQDNHFAGLLMDFYARTDQGNHEEVYAQLLKQAQLIEQVRQYATHKK